MVDGVLGRGAVAEDDVVEPQALDLADVDRVVRPLLGRQLHQLVESLHRGLGLPVDHDEPAQLLQRAEDRVEDDLRRDELAGLEGLAEDEPEQDEQDRLLEQVDDGALEEREAADLPHLLHLQVDDALGVALQPTDSCRSRPRLLTSSMLRSDSVTMPDIRAVSRTMARCRS